MKKMMIPKLAEVLEHSRRPATIAGWFGIIGRIYSFAQERANRAIRFLAITRCYRSGAQVKDIVDRYGCSRHTVLRYARLAGLPKRPKHFPTAIRHTVIRDYKAGLPIAKIAEINGVSQAYVSKTAREEGVARYKRRTK